MTTTPDDPTAALPGRPPVVDLATWQADADGVATWGPTSRSVPQWTRPGATPVDTLGRHGHHH